MAIKGKRKKKPRPTGPGRARPAGAARPAARPRQVPFYRTFKGQLATIVVVLALVGAGMWFFAERSSDAEALDARRDAVTGFTSGIRGLLQETNQSIREIAGAPFDTQNAAQLEGLEASSKSWVDSFQAAGAKASGLTPGEDLQPAVRVLVQAFQTYTGAARTYGLVPSAAASLRQDLLDRAAEQRQSANELVAVTLQIVDRERTRAGLRASGIQPPAALPPIVPTPAAEETQGQGRSNKGDDQEGDG